MPILTPKKNTRSRVILSGRADRESSLPSPAAVSEGLAAPALPVLSGQEAADMLYGSVTASLARGEEVLIASPTIRACEVERRLVRAFDEGIAEERLAPLLEEYLETHRYGSEDPWTTSEPLYYVTVRKDGETIKGYTANLFQVRILAELWGRRSRETEIRCSLL